MLERKEALSRLDQKINEWYSNDERWRLLIIVASRAIARIDQAPSSVDGQAELCNPPRDLPFHLLSRPGRSLIEKVGGAAEPEPLGPGPGGWATLALFPHRINSFGDRIPCEIQSFKNNIPPCSCYPLLSWTHHFIQTPKTFPQI